MNGKQSGDAAELAHAVVELIDWPTPPQGFVAGTDGVDSVAQKGHALLDQVEAYRWLSTSLETLDLALLGKHRSRPSS